MKWEQLLSPQRSRGGVGNRYARSTDLRSEFEKDYHRIIGSASFRRLQDKTQVFPLDKSDFIRTRLTHSLEVSSFAKSLGQNIGENILAYKKDPDFTPRMKEDICSIVQCAGLIHDIGNPPFGHFGEMAIREWFERNLDKLTFAGKPVSEVLTEQMKQDLYHFEGNAQALRLVTKLHYLVDEHGMNLTYALLNTIIKYPVASTEVNDASGNIKDKKLGYYYADREIFRAVQEATGTRGRRHPLTFILEAADDIAYKTADIEDAFVKGFLSYHQLLRELEALDGRYTAGAADERSAADGSDLRERTGNASYRFDALGKLNELYERGVKRGEKCPEEYAVKNWIVRVQGFLISCATFGFTSHYREIMEGTYGHDLFYGTFAEKLMDLLGDMAYRIVFTSEQIYKMEVTESVILNFLMDQFAPAVVRYDNPKEKTDTLDRRLIALISDNYKNAYHFQSAGKDEGEKLYLRLLLMTDYICGMTDSYAKRLYQELNAVL